MMSTGDGPHGSDVSARFRHQAFFETLQRDEGSREWIAARAGLLLLRHVVWWNYADWDPDGVVSQEESVVAAIEALPADDLERARLSAVIAAFHPPGLHLVNPDNVRALSIREPIAEALNGYGDVLLTRGAWALAADVYATVWDTRAVPDARSARAQRDEGADPTLIAREVTTAALISPTSLLAALNLALCLRMLGRTTAASEAYVAARAAAARCRNPHIGEYVRYRAWLGDALIILDRGHLSEADRQLSDLAAEISSNPRLRDVHARARHALAVVAYRRGIEARRHRGGR